MGRALVKKNSLYLFLMFNTTQKSLNYPPPPKKKQQPVTQKTKKTKRNATLRRWTRETDGLISNCQIGTCLVWVRRQLESLDSAPKVIIKCVYKLKFKLLTLRSDCFITSGERNSASPKFYSMVSTLTQFTWGQLLLFGYWEEITPTLSSAIKRELTTLP